MDKLSKLYEKGVSRRNFLAGAGALSAASVLAGCSNSGPAAPVTPPAPVTPAVAFNDVDILNFALNLEYLEAEFYLRAATGTGLSATDAGTGAGTVTGGTKIPGLTTLQQNILNEIAYDEQEHVKFLRAAITKAGATPVSRPNLVLDASFTAAATAANALSANNAAGTPFAMIPATFNPYADFNSFLVGAFVFEDVGVTAYNGAATLISTPGIMGGILSAAAGILAVEAYHAAYVRTALTGSAILAAQSTPSTPYPFLDYANRISALRASLGNGKETPLVLPTSPSTPSSIVAADTTNAIAFNRTPSEVLHIVYASGGGAGVSMGGFFPQGVNGNIKTTLS